MANARRRRFGSASSSPAAAGPPVFPKTSPGPITMAQLTIAWRFPRSRASSMIPIPRCCEPVSSTDLRGRVIFSESRKRSITSPAMTWSKRRFSHRFRCAEESSLDLKRLRRLIERRRHRHSRDQGERRARAAGIASQSVETAGQPDGHAARDRRRRPGFEPSWRSGPYWPVDPLSMDQWM